MTNQDTHAARPELDRLLVTGVTLAGAATALGLAGLAMSIVVLLGHFRRWMRQTDVTPSEIARHRWTQARAATTAGREAWRKADAGYRVHADG
ncbi:hypothetical protein ACVGVM_10740 [Pseudonocardia bannensis]|uniref:Uncharacterized protein n=1 Tax=Pseudonocardia bannensis TaxID=630973 RepID=A0A848DM52_9PSEU|nr:hypothetical protein [Pseudonocardia bannensis]NMH93837.1 hypothetical protein [Pseudonocardia bannensis]